MRPIVIALGIVLLIGGVVAGYASQLGSAGKLQTNCYYAYFDTVTFTGYVRNVQTGNGIANAKVFVHVDSIFAQWQPGATISADSSGRYYWTTPLQYGALSCSLYEFTTSATGYLNQYVTGELPDWANVLWTPTGFYTTQGQCQNYLGACTKDPVVTTDFALQQTNPLVAGFTYQANYLAVTFTDASSGLPTSWSWSFGDGSSSTSQSPIHTYGAQGTYTATETIYRSADGASASTSKAITVSSTTQGGGATQLIASFTYKATGLSVAFTDTSAGGATSWAWQFGDGATSTQESPSHTYANAYEYQATLTVTRSSDGAKSTATGTFTLTSGGTNQGGGGCTSNCGSNQNQNPPANTTCPSGWTGTAPNCVPPSSGGGFDLAKWDVNPISVGLLFIGLALALVGIVVPGGKK